MTPDAITRLNAALEGRYRIERQLGEGGMATVYLARDLKHNRNVALKVLKPELAAVVGAERFLAEIETTANLNHPHLLPLHDSGEADGFLYFVMPYVEGETLRDRLAREKQLHVEEAVAIARKVASALYYAHEHGVVHRDIKPGNILLQGGEPVVSDFGIALAVGAAGGSRLTETGLSVGTPYYMSPEQATGDQEVGPATDIYALGCVLYEMLVGDPPYVGSTAQAVLGKIIQGTPVSATEARRSVPTNVDAAIRKSLEKLPADRFSGAQAFAGALADPGFRHGESAWASTDQRRPIWQPAALVAVGLGLGVAVTALSLGGAPEPSPADVMRFTITSREDVPVNLGGAYQELAISRDGRIVVYQTGNEPSDWVLNLRRIDQLESTPLLGTEGGSAPFVSPDGEWVGFVDAAAGGGALLKVSVFGGPPVVIGEAGSVLGASWGAGDRIVFGTIGGGLFSVPSGGGEPEPLTVLDVEQGETSHRGPHVVDGHEVVLFVIGHGTTAPILTGELAALDLRSGEVSRLGLAGVSPRYTSSGHLVYVASNGGVRNGSLQAVPFDIGSLTVTGSPVTMLEDVSVKTSGLADFDVSRNGRLVYLPALRGSAPGSAPTNLLLVGRDGSRSILAELESFGWWPRFSEDGARIAYAVSEDNDPGSAADLWALDVARGAETRVTFEGNNRFYPIWSPDGTRLTHADAPGDQNRLVSTAADGSGETEVILDLGDRRFPTSWSPDGRTLAYYVGPAGTSTDSRDVWMLFFDDGEVRPQPFVETRFMERGAIFSPDGRWVAYVSDRSGQNDVYARPFPGPGAEVMISVGGGAEPVWSPSGMELYYRTEAELMVVSVDPDTPSLSVGPPSRVMADSFRRDTGGAAGGMANYDITPDGESFVMVEDADGLEESAVQPEMYIVLNWFEELRKRVPVPH